MYKKGKLTTFSSNLGQSKGFTLSTGLSPEKEEWNSLINSLASLPV